MFSAFRLSRLRGLQICLVLFLSCFGNMLFAQSNSIPTPVSVQVTSDDRAATFQWNGFPKWGGANPSGVTGYRVRWGDWGSALPNTLYVEQAAVQIQPLENGKLYHAQIEAIDPYGNLSAPTARITFTGSGSRVATLRQTMTGFFDDFNQPEGAPDEKKWNSAYSGCNDPEKNGFFINDQYHVHNALASLNGDRGQATARPRAVFDFTGRTGSIYFDFDGVGRRDIWYLDISPVMIDINTHVDLGFGWGYPGNSIRLVQVGNEVAIVQHDSMGIPTTLAASGDLLAYGIQFVTNVRRRWRVTVSQSQIAITIEGKLVCKAAVQLPWSKAFLLWTAFSYNTNKANQERSLMHWDNFGFDAPANAPAPPETHNYRPPMMEATTTVHAANFVPQTYPLQIPDSLAGATKARLMFTLQTVANQWYHWSPLDTVWVNGTAIPIPMPNGLPIDPLYLVSPILPYSVCIPLPLSALQVGANSLVFAMQDGGVINPHIEIDFPAGSAPEYTPPHRVWDEMHKHSATPVGSGTVIAYIRGEAVWAYAAGYISPAEIAVSGMTAIDVYVNGEVALLSTGKSPGIERVELWLDHQKIGEIMTNAQVPALGGIYRFMLDASLLSEGTHELFARSVSPTGVFSVPDYFQACAKTGDYIPFTIRVTR